MTGRSVPPGCRCPWWAGVRSPATVPVARDGDAGGGAHRRLVCLGTNESPSVEVFVPGFRIDATPVTNGEFLAFLDDGGYGRCELWAPDDWGWSLDEERSHPPAWTNQDGRWLYRGLFDLLPAGAGEGLAGLREPGRGAGLRAMARLRLPTEAEFHRAAYGDPTGGERAFPWGAATPGREHGNFDFDAGRPRRWARFPRARARGACTTSWATDGVDRHAVHGLPGFRGVDHRYRGYSADFFDGKHFVLKGGSWATATELLRRSFRKLVPAHYPYVFAKFRCVARG